MTHPTPVSALRLAREALTAARQFIRNGVEFGYIRMPDPETPDSAHETLPLVDRALNALAAADAQAAEPVTLAHELTDERIDKIADLVVRGMEDGLRGFMKTWGWQQFARALLRVVAPPSAEPAWETIPISVIADIPSLRPLTIEARSMGQDGKLTLFVSGVDRAANPSVEPVEVRGPLTQKQMETFLRQPNGRLDLREVAVVRMTEHMHGITPDAAGEPQESKQ
jgi:hypothetical protein